ncbi:unnamed protein product [Eruca vesicaria subsp. sativa]|uniref:Phorbol-ester/DAG-type domain-containing protein n=1 Tax=Eruca vesicaria subsp. sativa TaxID=29727 RepID=A0ABC8JHN9_ERUVS|nr:unnamed protein product [Eruca vesicaria subsp. sativa]
MDSLEHPLLSPLLCPAFRSEYFRFSYKHIEYLHDRDLSFIKINLPYYFPNAKDNKSFLSAYIDHGHCLYPLYWCNNKESRHESSCGACECTEIGTTYYFCDKCKQPYHKECVESPPLIKSPHHPKHNLQLITPQRTAHPGDDSKIIYCSYCDANYKYNPLKLLYYCFICNFGLDPVCATKPSFMNYHKRHEHTLNHFPRKTDLICDVCGVSDSNYIIYVCLQCDFVVHKKCIHLPFVIRISRHDHRLSFNYSLPKILSCGVCRQKVDDNYGNYSCIKDCKYVVHSKCATRIDVWDGKELEEEPEEENEDLNSFEVIGDGIIKHCSHSHHMMSEKKATNIVYDDKNPCQACLLPFSGGGVYICMKSNCDFVLHEACANLPRTKQHIAYPHPFILQVNDTNYCFFCGYCDRLSYGFRYVCSKGGESISIDVQCAAISEPFDHQCHTHPLFLSNELGKNRSCSICGKEKLLTLNCMECGFFLCFYCATLPYKVRYEYDEHFLTLSYKENVSLSWCEVCEETLDSNKWIYTCNECGATFHIKCLLGNCATYVKPAQNLLFDGDRFNIIPSNRLTRPICNDCGRRCQDKQMFEVYDDDDQKRLYCFHHFEVDDG